MQSVLYNKKYTFYNGLFDTENNLLFYKDYFYRYLCCYNYFNFIEVHKFI